MAHTVAASLLLAALGPLAPNAAITVGKATDGGGVAVRMDAVVEAPLANVHAVVSDFAAYPEWFPALSRMQPRSPREFEATFRFPWPLRTMRQRFFVARERGRDQAIVRWRHLDGDFARNEGAWRLRALDARRTLVRYDAVVQFRRWVPGWLISRAQRRGAAQLMRSLEARAQAPAARARAAAVP